MNPAAVLRMQLYGKNITGGAGAIRHGGIFAELHPAEVRRREGMTSAPIRARTRGSVGWETRSAPPLVVRDDQRRSVPSLWPAHYVTIVGWAFIAWCFWLTWRQL